MEWLVEPLADFNNILIFDLTPCCTDKVYFTDACREFWQCNGTAKLIINPK